jgi:hypothetical protein
MRPATKLASSFLRKYFIVIPLLWLIAACGGGSETQIVVQVTIQGKVFDGYIEGAIVCIDQNQNGRCDENEPRTRSDATGAYQLAIPKGSTAALVAEVIAGQSREGGQAGSAVDVSYRMASPSVEYSTNITPFSTLVHLTAEADHQLAEERVRSLLGLPPRFNINTDSPAAAGSYTQAVAASIVTALKAAAVTLDLSAEGALDKVVAAFPRTLTDLPLLTISTKNGAPIESREIYVDATFTLTNPAVSSQAASLNGKIRGRGHSTWGRPKNPYKVQFANDAKFAQLPDVLGMKKNRNWALLADFFDRSLLRNKLALSLANSSMFTEGMKWNSSGQHIEVTLNGDYIGVYLLTEDIRIAPERLNIKTMSKDPAVNDVDGGYIVEIDSTLDCYNQEPTNLQHRTPFSVPVCIDTPDEGSITQSQLSYIKNLVNAVEQDLYSRNSLERINPASFADWYLLNELFRNNDAAFWSSDFMWKDSNAAANPADRLVNMGPIWDFDLSAGNVNYNGNWKTEGCWVSKTPPWGTNWFSRIFDNRDFLNLTLARWKQKRPALEKFINSSIDTFSRRLELPQQRNYARWPYLGVQMNNYYTFTTYADEVAFLRSFLNERMAWLDVAYASAGNFNAMCK